MPTYAALDGDAEGYGAPSLTVTASSPQGLRLVFARIVDPHTQVVVYPS